jgi:hypothetical protein
MRKILFALLFAFASFEAQAQQPFQMATMPEQQSADTVSNLVMTPSASAAGNAKALFSLSVKVAAVSGYLMVFDATVLPSNGAITPCASGATARPCQLYCYPVASNGTNGGASFQWTAPMQGSSGIVVAFSSTGCDTLTASATAKFMGQAL